MQIGIHHYGRESAGESAIAAQFTGNPVIATVVDELRARGATNRAGVEQLLPELELQLGSLTDRERTAVLLRFES